MDKIFYNGKVYTMNPEMPFATAIGVRGNKIAVVGSNEPILALRETKTELIDLMGKAVIPGLNDSHMHLLGFGYTLSQVDLKGVKSIQNLIEKGKIFLKKNSIKRGQWILGRGWNQEYFNDKSYPTRYDLDEISKEIPICFTRTCGHLIVVNSKALELVGMDKYPKHIDGGRVDTDKSNIPNGILRENAISLIYNKIPKSTIEDIKKMIIDAGDIALSNGITSVQSDDLTTLPGVDYKEVLEAYNVLNLKDKLPIRVYEQCMLSNMDVLEEFLNSGLETGAGDDFFKLGPLKLFLDGSLGARTAYLEEPYSDKPNTSGILTYNKKDLEDLIIRAHKSKMQVALHCIGDGAINLAVQIFEKLRIIYPKKNTRHGIVHCQITDRLLIHRLAQLNLLAYIQPIFINEDMHIVKNRVGKKRMQYSYNWKSMINKGIKVCMGTDCPVEDISAMSNIYCAVTRKDLSGYPKEGWMPQQCLSIEEAVYSYTMGGAYSSFEENIKGSIKSGKFADFVILSQDVFKISSEVIKDTIVEATICNGQIRYEKK